MKRPGWAIAVGIIMLLFGGCGAFNRTTEIMMPDINAMMEESISDAKNDIDSELDPEKAARRDSVKASNAKKIGDLSEKDRKILDMISDTILVDDDNNIDMEATILQTSFISDYRKTWMVRFGYIGLFIAILFIVGGIMLLGFKKNTIPIVIAAIALSMVVNIFQIFIYNADNESGSLIGTFSNIGFYVSLAFDILLLILVLVLDKSFFKPSTIQEDYYD